MTRSWRGLPSDRNGMSASDLEGRDLAVSEPESAALESLCFIGGIGSGLAERERGLPTLCAAVLEPEEVVSWARGAEGALGSLGGSWTMEVVDEEEPDLVR